ncbi:MAG: MazG nucleotide pyrophosphohydrolase domain-containing protein [Candidatus Absconditabacterales bacterium]
MTLTFYDMQQQVDVWVSKTPDGYRKEEKIFEKIHEEHKEIIVAECEYIKVRGRSRYKLESEEKLKNLKTEIGDILFAVCCLANINGIHLQNSFNEAIEVEIQEVVVDTQLKLSGLKSNRDYGDLLYRICNLANIYGIMLEECFNLMMEKNENRAKNNYKKEEK